MNAYSVLRYSSSVDDDLGILIFLGAGVLVLIGIVFFGVLSSRRKKAATQRTFTVRQQAVGEQPFLASSDLDASDRRQEELFRETYPIGGSLVLNLVDAEGAWAEREVHVSRIGRSLRAGWPQARIGLTAYFREWENTEFPAVFPVKGTDRITTVELDEGGVTASDDRNAVVWSAQWSALLFSNGSDIVLGDGTGKTIRFDHPDGHPALEELLIKYGTLKQMHF